MENTTITLQEETNVLWQFTVIVGQEGNQTKHKVTLDKTYWQQLTGGKITAELLIKKSFNFLLAREPKESILTSFNLSIISTYFPEYEDEIKHA